MSAAEAVASWLIEVGDVGAAVWPVAAVETASKAAMTSNVEMKLRALQVAPMLELPAGAAAEELASDGSGRSEEITETVRNNQNAFRLAFRDL